MGTKRHNDDIKSDLAGLAREMAAPSLVDANRPIRLRLAGERGGSLEHLLLAQRIDVREAVCGGISAHLTCLSSRADLPLQALLGVPLEIQLVTDRGALRRFALIVTEARAGQSDGGLSVFQLEACDALEVMSQRINSRVFRRHSVDELSEVLMREWRQRSSALARCFDFDISRLGLGRYPKREFTLQYNESDAAFLRRSWRRAGIGWYVRPVETGPQETPRHCLVLFDDSRKLPENAAGTVRYHRDAATEARDAVTLLARSRRLVPGRLRRSTWDYREARVRQSEESNVLDQGDAGRSLSALLRDQAIEIPHAGDSWADHDRLTRLRMLRHETEGDCIHGVSGVRDLAAGEWNRIRDHAELDRLPPEAREQLIIEVQHVCENNLPKLLDQRVQALLADSQALPGWWHERTSERRYQNRFVAVRRDIPYVPAWSPAEHLPPMLTLTAKIVGPEGEEVHTDALGRYKLQILGLDPEDHAHDNGAGTSGAAGDSAWVRAGTLLAGQGFGTLYPLRAGMEVQLHFIGGDPDRPVIAGVLYNASNPPPRFSRVGGLPGNRYLSGVRTCEIHGLRYNQLRFDDTPREISAQLASEQGHSQLNLGALTHPRVDGRGEARGNGFELRSDGSGALRSAKGLLISAWERLQATDRQMSATEHLALMEECLQLFKALGAYAAKREGLPVDEAPQALLANVAIPAEAPVISLSAPAGVALTTPKSLLSYAGLHVDCVAQFHQQYASGGRFVINAGKGYSLFANEGDVRTIACKGRWLAQSQHGDARIDAAKDLELSSGAQLAGMAAKQVVLKTAGGAYIKLSGGDIEIGGPGTLHIKASSHHWEGPASMNCELPSWPKPEAFVRGEGRYSQQLLIVDPLEGHGVETQAKHYAEAEPLDNLAVSAGHSQRLLRDEPQEQVVLAGARGLWAVHPLAARRRKGE